MSFILVYALCQADPGQRDAEAELYYNVARDLIDQEEATSAVASAMADVAKANDVHMRPNIVGWQAMCRLNEPGMTVGVPPLFLIVRMNPVHNGFDFQSHKVALHAAIRHHLWAHMKGQRGDGGITIDFGVRVEFVDAAGSIVTSEGRVEGEYGGDTGVRHL